MKKVLAIPILLLLIGLGFGVAGYVLYDWIWGADLHLRAGEEALERGDFAQADAHVRLLLESRPNYPEAHLLAARIARRAILPVLPGAGEGMGHSLTLTSARTVGSYDQAEQHLSQYKKLGGIAELYDLEQGLLKAQSGGLLQVEPDLKDWLAKDPEHSVLILEALIKGYLQAYRLGDALTCLNQWLEQNENVQALIWRAWVRERQHDFLNAKKDYLRALELDPENDDARRRLAEMLANAAPAEAVTHFVILYQHQPANPGVVLGLVQCRRALGQTEEAHQLLDQLLASHPRSCDALIERGMLALSENHPAEAESWLRQALAIEPYSRVANYQLFLCLEQLGKKEEAQKVKAKVEKIAEDLQLLADATAHVMAAPGDPQWRYEAGMILLRNEQKEEGLRWLLSALEMDPRHAPTHAALAAFYEREGKREQANYHRRLAQRGGTGAAKSAQKKRELAPEVRK
jgi:Tfp pilus assembly protein PilF